jgi:SAM-dependent methyltransferase
MNDPVSRHLALLSCPKCGSALAREGDGLACAHGHVHPIREGIPRFVPTEAYAGSFGFQWKTLGRLQLDSVNGTGFSAARFHDITGWGEADLRGRLVLDAGCGAGRFAEVVARQFGSDLVAIDLSDAVEACRENLMPDPPLVCQASIYATPFRPASFDFVYCIGVIQHTPDPIESIRSLARLVRPGGRIGLWIYEADWKSYVGTLGFKRLLRPWVRSWPRARQLAFSRALTRAFFPVVRALRPLGLAGKAGVRLLPVAAGHLLQLPLTPEQLRQWVLLDTFDMYASAYDEPQQYATVARVLAEEGFTDIERHPEGAIAITGRRAG